MKASDKQLALINIKHVKKQIICLVGAFRSGKTLFGATLGFCELMIYQQINKQVFEGNRYAVVGHANVTATYKNVVKRMIDYLRTRGWICTKHGNNYDFTITKGKVTFYIETFAASNSVSYEKLQAGTYRSIFIDEGPLMSNETIENIIGRCSTFNDWKVIITGNPEGNDSHPFYETYLSGNEKILYIHFTMLDNPINTLDKIEYFKTIFTETMYRQKVLGEWVAVEGMVYPNAPTIKDRPNGDEGNLIKFDYIHFGLDYGENDATTVVAVGVIGDDYYIFDQYYHKAVNGDRKTIIDYKHEISQWINEIYDVERTKCSLFVETSPVTVYSLFTNDKEIDVNVRIKKADKTKSHSKSKDIIQERIDVTNVMINSNRLFICNDKLPVYKAFKNAKYKNNKRLDDGSSDIDSLDAFEYAIKPDFKYLIRKLGVM
ncbi:MAG: hypothetical protein ACK5LC_13235 [Coprobacillaceae bacterium]